MTLVEKLSDVRDFRKILETTVKEIGENYSSDVCQIILSNPLDSNFTSICEYIANPDEEIQDELPFTSFPLHLEGGGLGLLNVSRQNGLSIDEVNEIRITLANIADILRYAQINDLVQRDTFRSAFMSEITNLMSLPMGLGDALFMVVNILGKALQVSRCIFICVDDSHSDWKAYEYWQRERIEPAQTYGWPTKDSAIVSQTLLSAVPIICSEGQQNSYKTPVQEEMEFIGVRSQLSVAIRSSIGVHGAIILQQCESRHAWTRDEIDIAQSVADTVAEALAQLPEEKKEIEPIMRLHQHDVAETKVEQEHKSIQEVRKALKGAMRTTTIAKAQTSKKPEPPPAPPAPPQAPEAPGHDLDFAPDTTADAVPQHEYSYESPQYEQAVQYDQTQYEQTQYDAYGEGQAAWGAQDVNYDQVQEPDFASANYDYSAPQDEGQVYAGPTASEMGGLAEMLQEQAQQSPAEPAGEQKFKGVLGGLLGNRGSNVAAGAWDIPVSQEQPPPPPSARTADMQTQPTTAPVPPVPPPPLPGNIAAAKPASKWGDLDAIPSSGQAAPQVPQTAQTAASDFVGMVPGDKPASKWGDLDAIPSPGLTQPAQKGGSKWGDLDAIPSPGARQSSPVPAAVSQEMDPGWGNLDAIPTPSASAKTGLGAMMMGKAKASAVGAGGLGASFHKGGVKPPAPPNFVEGPPIEIDEAAAEAKLKQILASSNPTSDFIFATPGIDMRLLGRIDGWVSQVEAKDKHVNGHVRAVAEYSIAVARLLGLSSEEVNNIRLAAIVHDVGKLGLPQQILQKPDEELSDAELVMTMNHPIDGAKLIEGFPELAPLAPIILAHHEEYDGNGYPEGLSDDNIPLEARIIFVCNAYVEMVTDLVYRSGMAPETAQNELIRKAGTTYDPNVVQALVACISQGVVPAVIS